MRHIAIHYSLETKQTGSFTWDLVQLQALTACQLLYQIHGLRSSSATVQAEFNPHTSIRSDGSNRATQAKEQKMHLASDFYLITNTQAAKALSGATRQPSIETSRIFPRNVAQKHQMQIWALPSQE